MPHDLLAYLNASPTPYHAVAETARRLDAAGYVRLDEADAWQAEPGLRGYVTRMALIPEGDGQAHVELEAFKTLLESHLVDPTYESSPSNSIHDAGAYVAAIQG